MLKSVLAVALSAGAIALGGAAFAQTGGSSGAGTDKGTTTEKSMPDKGTSGSMTKTAEPSKALIGRDLVDTKGETIGEVEEIDGNSLIVGVGGFLGIGERKVAVNWDQVKMTGSGKDAKLQVNMSKDELEALPEYKSKSKSMGR